MVGPVLTGWNWFWQKMTVLTRNGLKLIFYPGQHGLTRIDQVDSVLVKMTFFNRNDLKTHFLPWSTWFDPYWSGGLGFGRKWRFWPETSWNSFFTLIDMVWPVLTRWTRFWWKDVVDSRKIYFWILNFFLNFFGFLWIIIEIKQHSRKSWWIQNWVTTMLLKGIFKILFLISIPREIVVANKRVSSLICFWSFLNNWIPFGI